MELFMLKNHDEKYYIGNMIFYFSFIITYIKNVKNGVFNNNFSDD